VTLAGDPKQLGPVIHSRLARDGGLNLSLLERLASSMPYAGADSTTSQDIGCGSRLAASGLIVKLVRNYRSHPSLLQLPSKMFYGGELQACADPELTESMLHWQELPNNK
jgi:superfamily I DNA and/or RNA helicase